MNEGDIGFAMFLVGVGGFVLLVLGTIIVEAFVRFGLLGATTVVLVSMAVFGLFLVEMSTVPTNRV